MFFNNLNNLFQICRQYRKEWTIEEPTDKMCSSLTAINLKTETKLQFQQSDEKIKAKKRINTLHAEEKRSEKLIQFIYSFK